MRKWNLNYLNKYIIEKIEGEGREGKRKEEGDGKGKGIRRGGEGEREG